MINNFYCTDQQIIDWHYRTVRRYRLAETPAAAIRFTCLLKNISLKMHLNESPKSQNNTLNLLKRTIKIKDLLKIKEQSSNGESTAKAYINHAKFWGGINKITLHITAGNLLSNIELYPSFYMAFCCFGNQSPQIIRSKQAIAEFNVIKGAIIGTCSNLQNKNKLYFLYKWAFIVAGLPSQAKGACMQLQCLGVNNVFIFPELDKYNYYLFEPISGLDLTFAKQCKSPLVL